MNYWEEAFCIALEEANIPLPSQDLIERATKIIEGAHENYSMAHGYDRIPDPMTIENDRLKRQLMLERQKIQCKVCEGNGRIISYGPHHSSNMQCDECRGEGKVLN